MVDINVEMLREKLYKVSSALFKIGEVCVDASKMHISEEEALNKIRNYLYDTDVICSRYHVDLLIEECMGAVISNTFEEPDNDWLNKLLKERTIQPDINYPSCCDGCSNNPKNGGSGICNCTLPYMQNPTTYTVKQEDFCMVNSTGGYVYTTNTQLPSASTVNIKDAIERTKPYMKE